MEFETTLKGEKPTSQTCVVYDQHDGRIVMVHEFIGDGTGLYGQQGLDERARLTLEDARQHHTTPERLQLLHLEPNFKPAMNTLYHVDVAAGKLVARRQVAHKAPAISSIGGVKPQRKGP